MNERERIEQIRHRNKMLTRVGYGNEVQDFLLAQIDQRDKNIHILLNALKEILLHVEKCETLKWPISTNKIVDICNQAINHVQRK